MCKNRQAVVALQPTKQPPLLLGGGGAAADFRAFPPPPSHPLMRHSLCSSDAMALGLYLTYAIEGGSKTGPAVARWARGAAFPD